MRYLLQKKVPYTQSKRWEIHQNYYQSVGLKAWLKQEVPFNVTSNSRAAWQVADLVFQSLKDQTDPIHILETGAGLGLFAIHFLEAFKQLWKKNQLTLPPLKYWITDYSPQTLKEAQVYPVFKAALDSGELGFYHLDLETPTQITDLSGELQSVEFGQFGAIIGNYQHSPLNTAVLLHQAGQWYEKHTELYYWLTPNHTPTAAEWQAVCKLLSQRLLSFQFLPHIPQGHPQTESFANLDQAILKSAAELNTLPSQEEFEVKAWLLESLKKGWSGPDLLLEQSIIDPLFDFQNYELEQTEEATFFQKIELDERVKYPKHREVLGSLSQTQLQSTILYPEVSLKAFESWLPYLHTNGLIITTDKGHYHQDCMLGFYDAEATIHGNSLAHAVNFPLISQCLNALGCDTLDTAEASFALQTQVISKTPLKAEVKSSFQTHFIEHNQNEYSHAFLEAGHLFMNQGQLHKAIQYFLKGLKSRPNDATLLYFLSVCHLNLEQYTKALNYLESPHDDYFMILNFAILKAEAYRALGLYEKALPSYDAANQYFGESSLVYFNKALCYEELKLTAQALETYEKALALDPTDHDTLENITRLKESGHE